MFLKIWLCPTHSSIVGPERIFHGGMRMHTCTAQTYPVGDGGGFFHKKIDYALLTFQCLSPTDTLVLSSKEMIKLNQLGSGSWSSNKEKSCNAR
jgi:hypothetical protein